MTSNKLISGNNTMDNIKLKANSLMALVAELQEPSHNYKFNPSICNDILMYIKNVETDCQRILTSNKYNVFPNIHNSFDRMNIPKSIQTVNNVDNYNGKFQKFEDEIDFHVDKVIKSLYETAGILTIHHEEISQLDKQTDSIYQKLNSEKEMINNAIDKVNNTNMEKEFWKWRERLKQKNEINVSFTKEALKLKSSFQQKFQEYLKILDSKIEENEKNIINKRQQIENEQNKIKNLKIELDIQQTSILDNQNLIEEKQSQLKDIESKYEKESKEFEKKKLQRHKNQSKMELMQFVMKHHEKENQEKIQFYHNNIITPLELKLNNYITLVEHEKMRNSEIEANVIEVTPEFQKEMNNLKLQTRLLDKSLHNQYGMMKQFQDDFRKIELNVLSELDKSTTKIYNFMNIFETVIQYNTIMEKNNEIKQKNTSLECELFQKQYELQKKKEKKVLQEKEENQLKAQLDKLKQSIRQQVAYRKVLSYKKNQIHKQI